MNGRGTGIDLEDFRTLFEVGTVGALTDDQLLERFNRGGDPAEVAFGALVEKHGPMVLRTCRSILRNPDDAEDAFQATFLVLALKADTIRDPNSVASWLFGIARRVALRARSQNARRVVNEGREMGTIPAGPRISSPPEPLPEVYEEVDRLPEKYRRPIILCYLEGMTHEEASAQLRCPVGTVKIRLSRARERLRGRLTRRGLAPSVLSVALTGKISGMMPAPFVRSTIEAAARVVAGRPPGTSAIVLSLVQGVLRTMFLNKFKTTTALLITSMTLTLAAMVAIPRPARSAQEPTPKASVTAPVAEGREMAVETLTRSDFRIRTAEPATVQAFESAEISPRIGGYLKSLNVDIGDVVQRGQLLGEIDSPELDADVEREKAIVSRARAKNVIARSAIRVAEAGLAAEKSRASLAESSEKVAEDAMRLSQKQLDYTKELAARAGVSRKEVDLSQLQFDSTVSAVQVAKARTLAATADALMAEAKRDLATAELGDAFADLTIAEASLSKARILQGFTRIISPLDGIVTRRNYQTGDYVRPGIERNTTPLLSIVKTGKVRVVVAVPDRYANKLDRGDPATVWFSAPIDHNYQGVISRTAFALDPATRTVRAEIDLENAEGLLRPGQYGTALIILQARTGVLSIPSSAILEQLPDNMATCYRVVEGRAVKTRIKTGDKNENRFEVIDGLNEGDSVIEVPDDKISDGLRIKPSKKVSAKRE